MRATSGDLLLAAGNSHPDIDGLGLRRMVRLQSLDNPRDVDGEAGHSRGGITGTNSAYRIVSWEEIVSLGIRENFQYLFGRILGCHARSGLKTWVEKQCEGQFRGVDCGEVAQT